MSLWAYMETQLAAPAPDEAALKRSVKVMSLFVMCPPALQPMATSRSGSAIPRATRASTPALTSKMCVAEVAANHVAQERIAVSRAAAIVRPENHEALPCEHLRVTH